MWDRLQAEATAYDRNPTERKWAALRDRKPPGFKASLREIVACNVCVVGGVHSHAASLRQCAEALGGVREARAGWVVGGGLDPKKEGADAYYTSVRDLAALHLTFKGAVAKCLKNERTRYEAYRTNPREQERWRQEGAEDPSPWLEGLAPPYVQNAVARAKGPTVPKTVMDALGQRWGGLFRWYGLRAGGEASPWEGERHTAWEDCVVFRGVSEETWREAAQVFNLKFKRRDEVWDWGRDEAGRAVKNAEPSYVDDRYAGGMPEAIHGYEVGVGGNIPIKAPQRTPPEPSVTVCWRKK